MRTVILQALGAAGVTAAWALSELDLAGAAGPGRGEVATALSIWALAYLAGFRAGQELSRSPDRWRLPYIVSALGLLLMALLARAGAGPVAAFVVSSTVLGLYTASSTRIMLETVPSEGWGLALARLRLVGGTLYALIIIAVVVLERSGLLGDASLVYPMAALGALLAGLAVRRPAVPEVALDQLEKSLDSLVFGDPLPSFTYRGLASLGMLFSLAVIARILTLKTYQPLLGPVAVMALYAVLYSLGAVLGARLPSPGLAALAGIVMALVHLALSPGRLAGLIELGSSLVFSGYAEAGLILYVLRTAPGMIGTATLTAAATMAASSLASVALLEAGLGYDTIVALLAGLALALQYRRPYWQ